MFRAWIVLISLFVLSPSAFAREVTPDEARALSATAVALEYFNEESQPWLLRESHVVTDRKLLRGIDRALRDLGSDFDRTGHTIVRVDVSDCVTQSFFYAVPVEADEPVALEILVAGDEWYLGRHLEKPAQP